MCGIIGSFSKDKIQELFTLNKTRGNKAYSFTVIDDSNQINVILKKGEFKNIPENTPDSCYYILHIQSPTEITEITASVMHPSIINNVQGKSYLWHNGMLTNKMIEKLKLSLNCNNDWDTILLHKTIGGGKDFYNNLDYIEGSFACLHYSNGLLKMFRNKVSPLYYDDEGNISSIKFPESKMLKDNIIYELDFENKQIVEGLYHFNNCYNPYNI